MWLPHRLYESLPLIYVATAGLCVFALEISPGSTLSAAALSAAAMTTWNMRRKARSAVLKRRTRSSRRPAR